MTAFELLSSYIKLISIPPSLYPAKTPHQCDSMQLMAFASNVILPGGSSPAEAERPKNAALPGPGENKAESVSTRFVWLWWTSLRVLAQVSRSSGSEPGVATQRLCDLGQVTQAL